MCRWHAVWESSLAERLKSVIRAAIRPGLMLVSVLLSLSLLAGLCSLVYLMRPPPSLTVLIVLADEQQLVDTLLPVQLDPSTMQVHACILTDFRLESDTSLTVTDAVEQLKTDYDLSVDRTLVLEYGVFLALIEAVEGVDVYVERVLSDENAPDIIFQSGWHHFTGERALSYTRLRTGLPEDDPIARQYRILSAFSHRLKESGDVLSVLRVLRHHTGDMPLLEMIAYLPPVVTAGERIGQIHCH